MASTVKTRRNQMTSTTVDRIRLLEKDKGVTRETLEDIKAVMLELAAHTELFPAEDFVIEKDDKGNFPIYRLAEDDDHALEILRGIVATLNRPKRVSVETAPSEEPA